MGGGGGNSGPTLQEQQLQTEQALTNANLNLEENQQRKAILNSMVGTRVFRGSALSRALVGNTPGQGGDDAGPAPSRAQATNQVPIAFSGQNSLIEQAQAASGATASGGTGGSADATALTARSGAYGGGGGARLFGPGR